jgi:heme exporter protein C
VMVRGSIESPQRRALVAAVYGIIAFLDVPLVYLSTRLMPDIHPASVQLATEMKLTLAAWFVPVFMLAGGLVVAKFRLEQAQDALGVADDEPAGEPARQSWAGGVA